MQAIADGFQEKLIIIKNPYILVYNIVTKELGILGMFDINKTIIKSEVIKTYGFYIAIMKERALYILEVIKIQYTRTTSTKVSVSIPKEKSIGLLKNTTKVAISSIAQGLAIGWIKKEFPNYYEEIKAQYQRLAR